MKLNNQHIIFKNKLIINKLGQIYSVKRFLVKSAFKFYRFILH